MMEGWGLDTEKDLDRYSAFPVAALCPEKGVPACSVKQQNAMTAEMTAAIAGTLGPGRLIYQMFLYELDNHD